MDENEKKGLYTSLAEFFSDAPSSSRLVSCVTLTEEDIDFKELHVDKDPPPDGS